VAQSIICGILFIAVSTETDFPHAPEGSDLFGATQLQWLQNDLEKATQLRETNQISWIIVGGHRPIYSSSLGFCNDTGFPISDPRNLQLAMENLFFKYKIDLFICGHVHSYERCYPTYDGKAVSTSYDNPQAPVYIIAGAAGSTEGLSNPTNNTWVQPPPSWSGHRYGEGYGYGILQVTEDQINKQDVAQWTFYRSLDNGIEDQITITKDMN